MFYVYKTCSLISRELTESVQRKPTFLLVSSSVFHCYRLYVLHIALPQKEKELFGKQLLFLTYQICYTSL